MAKIVSPASLWGKPLPRAPNSPVTKEKAARVLPDKKIDSDVDAELEEDTTTMAELADEDSVEDEDEVSTVAATGADDDDDDDEDEDEDDEDDEDEDESEDAEEDEEFESEEGDDDDDDVENSVDSTVDVDEVPVPAAIAAGVTPKVMTMTEKKSIADYVRDNIADRKSAGESLRGIDIVNSLAKRRIKVSPAQVSQLLKKSGVSQKARGGRKVVAVATTGTRSRSTLKAKTVEPAQQAPKIRATTGTTTELPWKQLSAARAFIAACNGSFEEASGTLSNPGYQNYLTAPWCCFMTRR